MRVGAPVEPTPLEIWLPAQWGAHTRIAGRTWWVPNEHAAWPLHSADILELRDDLLTAPPCRLPDRRFARSGHPASARASGRRRASLDERCQPRG